MKRSPTTAQAAKAQHMPGIEVEELHGADAVDSILSDFSDLALQPIAEDAERARLRRAGMTVEQSQRRALRAEQKGGAA